MFNLIIIGTIVTLVKSHDVTIGSDVAGNTKIFDEDRYASPAIWKQAQNVTINATGNHVISKIIVTDTRPEKDGEVKILEGGEGQSNVTLELKSPTALRGFAFHIEVYSAPKDNVKSTATSPKVEEPLHPSQSRQRREPEDYQHDEANVNAPVTTYKGTADSDKPYPTAADTKIHDEKKNINSDAEKVRPARDVTSEKSSETKPTIKPKTDVSKTLKSEEGVNVPRLTRDAVKEYNENAEGSKRFLPSMKDLTHPHQIATSKLSTESPDKVSTAKSLIDESKIAANDGKRAVRDTETDIEERDELKHSPADKKSHEHDSHVPSTQSMKNPTPPRELRRHVSQPIDNNNSTKRTENGAFLPPLGHAKAEPTDVKVRVVRDTEDKKAKSPPFVASNDAKSPPLPTANTGKQNYEGKAIVSTPSTSQTQDGRRNAANPRYSNPLPYASLSSSSTEKSEKKRDTEPKSSEKKQQTPKVDVKNSPRPFIRQHPKVGQNDKQPHVVSIQ